MKPIHRSSLRGLRTFCVAAHYESFRAAGEALFVTASAISHQIKALEEALAIELFDRSGGQLKLTVAGKAMFDEIAPLIDEIDDIVGRYKDSGARKSVRVSVQPFFASEYFVPRLNDFSQKNPDIDIYVGSSDEAAEKHPSDADLSVRLFSAPPKRLQSQMLFPLRMAPAGSPEFKQSVQMKGASIVSDFPLIVHETLPKAWQQWSDMTQITLPPQPKVTRLGSMIAVLRATQRGLGAALVPVPMGELWFSEGSVVRLFEQELISDSAYYLVWKEGALANDSVRSLHDWVLTCFEETPEKNS